MQKKDYSFEILVHGKPIKEYRHKGEDFVEGRNGTEFQIRIKNDSDEEVLAVPTVDGLSVIDGKKGSFDSPGYVIGANSSVTVKGWRVSDESVRSFFFTGLKKSYSVKSGNGKDDVGVIGVAFFKDRNKAFEKMIDDLRKEEPKSYPVPYYPPPIIIQHGYGCQCWQCRPYRDTFYTVSCDGNTGVTATLTASSNTLGGGDNLTRGSLCAAAASCSAPQEIGAGWGDEKTSKVEKVKFSRESSPDAVMEIRYNSRGALEEMGIDFSQPMKISGPKAFPKESGYCKPPRS